MLGRFNPSKMMDEIYDMLDAYETEGLDLYNRGAVDALVDYLHNYTNLNGEYLICCTEWPNEEGGSCSAAFVENGHPQLIVFDFKY